MCLFFFDSLVWEWSPGDNLAMRMGLISQGEGGVLTVHNCESQFLSSSLAFYVPYNVFPFPALICLYYFLAQPSFSLLFSSPAFICFISFPSLHFPYHFLSWPSFSLIFPSPAFMFLTISFMAFIFLTMSFLSIYFPYWLAPRHGKSKWRSVALCPGGIVRSPYNKT